MAASPVVETFSIDTSRMAEHLERLTALLYRDDLDVRHFQIVAVALQHGVYIHNSHERGRYYVQFKPFARAMIQAVLEKYESESYER